MNSAGVPQAAPAPHLAPGRMGVRLAVLSTAIGLAAVNTGNNLLYVMLSLILGLAVVSSVAARRALHTLRVDARFPREVVCGEPFCFTVETAGRLDDLGRVVGDVYLVGGGDPNLSGRFHEGRAIAPFEQLAAQMETAGIRRI